MSVMSAAEAGQTPGTGQEIFPRGPRTATSATDQDAVGPEASSRDERSAEADPSPSARRDRRLRLVTTEVHVTEVRVAREVSTRTVRVGGPRVSVHGAGGPGVSVPGTAQQVSAERASVQRASVQRASMPRASMPRVTVPGASARRVSVQRASAQRASVRQTSMRPGGLRLTRRGRRVLTGFAMLVIVISAMLIGTSVAGGAQAPGPGAPARSAYQGMTQIVVRPGQTLWSIAAAAEPSADPWAVVQQISDANALNGAQVQAGQLLWVPRG
jgi:hypothetical protein